MVLAEGPEIPSFLGLGGKPGPNLEDLMDKLSAVLQRPDQLCALPSLEEIHAARGMVARGIQNEDRAIILTALNHVGDRFRRDIRKRVVDHRP